MLVKSLQTKGVFACTCQIQIDLIECEFLATNGTQESFSNLLDPETDKRYLVEVPPGKNVFLNCKLRRMSASI